jgi:hypothetical protein
MATEGTALGGGFAGELSGFKPLSAKVALGLGGQYTSVSDTASGVSLSTHVGLVGAALRWAGGFGAERYDDGAFGKVLLGYAFSGSSAGGVSASEGGIGGSLTAGYCIVVSTSDGANSCVEPSVGFGMSKLNGSSLVSLAFGLGYTF